MDEKKVKAGGSDDRLAIGAIRRKENGIECRGNERSRLKLKSLETNEGGVAQDCANRRINAKP